MSLVTVVPECVNAAAQDLSSIGSAIEVANATAAAPLTALAPPAGDAVSAQVVRLFSDHAATYQSISVQAAAFHHNFVRAFSAAGASYPDAEAANTTRLQTPLRCALGEVRKAQKPLGPALLGNRAEVVERRGGLRASGLRVGSGTFVPGIASTKPIASLRNTVLNEMAPLTAGPHAGPRWPFFHQIVANQIGYWRTIIAALETGNLKAIYSAVETVTAELAQNFSAVIGNLADFSWFLHVGLRGGEIFFGTPIALFLDMFGAPVNALLALQSSAVSFCAALKTGDLLGALTTLVEAPAKVANAFLVGETMLDLTIPVVFNPGITSLEVEVPMGGLFAPLNSVELILNGGGPMILGGTQLGGFFTGVRSVGGALAQLIDRAALRQ
ncbi:PE family protein [Mycobacterium haemophilum]|uniref:PE family protein n=1 Tax=Mycobacterium haemophilum TaxID=29311 RepID=UPI000699C7A3|nr:PE family protein [Mycobacterium haemophilum]